jgi:hypothetical protein
MLFKSWNENACLHDSGAYSTTPPASSLPRRTSSPLSFIISSIVLIFPSLVLSLNQPRWSAIRCLLSPISHHQKIG